MSGVVKYDGDRYASIVAPLLVLEAGNGGLYPFALVETEATRAWPSAGLPFRIEHMLPGPYLLRAQVFDDTSRVLPAVLTSSPPDCPRDEVLLPVELGNEDLTGIELTLFAREDWALACPGHAADVADQDAGASDAGADGDPDPFAGFGDVCEAGSDRAARNYTSLDCPETAPHCAALPDEDLGFCTLRNCEPEDCPPGWLCFDVSIVVEGAPRYCIDPSQF